MGEDDDTKLFDVSELLTDLAMSAVEKGRFAPDTMGLQTQIEDLFDEALEQGRKYRQMLAHADRKAEHGCTDAYCPICDGEGA